MLKIFCLFYTIYRYGIIKEIQLVKRPIKFLLKAASFGNMRDEQFSRYAQI